MAEPAHVLLVLEVDAVEVEGEVALGEGLEVAQAAGDHHLVGLLAAGANSVGGNSASSHLLSFPTS